MSHKWTCEENEAGPLWPSRNTSLSPHFTLYNKYAKPTGNIELYLESQLEHADHFSFNNFLGLVQSFALLALFSVLSHESKCRVSVKYFKWQGFSKVYLKMALWKEYSFVLCGKKQTECRSFSMGKSLIFSSHYLCHIQFPKYPTFKFVLHGFILGNENQRADNWAQVHLGLKMPRKC